MPILQQKFLLIAVENERLHTVIRAYKKYWDLGGRREEEEIRNEIGGRREEEGRRKNEEWKMMEERGEGMRVEKGEDWRRDINRRWEEEGGKRNAEDLRREVGRREEGARRGEEGRGWEAGWEGERREALRDKENVMDGKKWREGEKNRYFY